MSEGGHSVHVSFGPPSSNPEALHPAYEHVDRPSLAFEPILLVSDDCSGGFTRVVSREIPLVTGLVESSGGFKLSRLLLLNYDMPRSLLWLKMRLSGLCYPRVLVTGAAFGGCLLLTFVIPSLKLCEGNDTAGARLGALPPAQTWTDENAREDGFISLPYLGSRPSDTASDLHPSL